MRRMRRDRQQRRQLPQLRRWEAGCDTSRAHGGVMFAIYTYEQAARRLYLKDASWLRRNISQLPHTKICREVLFTDDDLERIVRAFHVEPDAGPLAPPAATAPTADDPEQPLTLASIKPLARAART